jgi:hypothetical protein
MQSVFTSPFFTAFVNDVLPQIEDQATFLMLTPEGKMMPAPRQQARTKFDGTNDDIENFLNKFGAFLGDTTCDLSTGIGYRDDGQPMIADLDPVNAEVGNAAYRLRQHQSDARYYFPTQELVQALNDTDLKWVDLRSFADLPAVVGIRLRGFKCKVNSEIHNCDDFLLMRDDTPGTRKKALEDHAVPEEHHDTALVFHWITQSRDELHLGLQSQTFGTFVLHQDMKLDTIIDAIDEWSEREIRRVRGEAYSLGLLDRVDGTRERVDSDPYADAEDVRLVSEHAGYLTNTLKQLSWDDDQRQWYGDILRFVFKFVLLLSAEGVKVKPLLPPGVKDKPNLSRKARKVHEALWKSWGKRYLVDVPAQPNEDPQDRKSPTRHLVHGFFRQQAHGPHHSLRRIVWVHPFMRGTTSLA